MDKEMTRYAFMSHMEDYMKHLLYDPIHADTDSFLHEFGIDGPVALKMLLKRTDPNDETSAIIMRSERIKDNGVDDNGKRNKDTFEIKYKIPRKDFKKKLRNLYINLFEQNIIKDCPINEDLNYYEMQLSSTPNPFKDKKFGKVHSLCRPGSIGDRFAKYVNDNEKGYEPKLIWHDEDEDEKEKIDEGAWGYGPLENDSALDFQSEFATISIRALVSKVKNSSDYSNLWARLGVLIDFLKKYKDDEIQLTDEYNYAIDVSKAFLNDLLINSEFIKEWSEPDKFKSSVKKLLKDVSLLKYQKEIMNPLKPEKTPEIQNQINEDGECGVCGGAMDGLAGATSDSEASNGQYTTPLFGKPIKRKTMYITQEQADYLKEATTTMNTGNYQYTVPFGDKNNDFYDEAMDHENIMKKSFKR